MPKAEALIKALKGYCRGVIATLKWNLPYDMVQDLVAFATQRLNILETKSGLLGISPIEAFTGIKVDVEKEARFSFGQYVHCVKPNINFKNDVFKRRTESGISVGQHGRGGAVLWAIAR